MKVIFTYRGGRRQRMQRRYAETLQKLGRGTYMTRDMQASPAQPPTDGAVQSATSADELAALRAEYHETVGKRPYHGWDAAQLRAKIAEAGE